MKIKVGLSLLLLSLVLVACGNKTQEKEQVSKEQEALVRQIIDEGGIVQVGTQYELRITEHEAVKKGVTPESYRQMLQMVEDMNRLLLKQIEEAKRDPNTQSMDLNGQPVFNKESE